MFREDSKEEARLEYRGVAAGNTTVVPSTTLPACCEVTVTLERLTPAAFAKHCLYLHNRRLLLNWSCMSIMALLYTHIKREVQAYRIAAGLKLFGCLQAACPCQQQQHCTCLEEVLI